MNFILRSHSSKMKHISEGFSAQITLYVNKNDRSTMKTSEIGPIFAHECCKNDGDFEVTMFENEDFR